MCPLRCRVTSHSLTRAGVGERERTAAAKGGVQRAAPGGGRYLGQNLEVADQVQAEGGALTPKYSKRWNFLWNFLGEKGPTIDEQMSKLFRIKEGQPAFYGPYQTALNELAAKHGVDPREFQEAAWAGHKAMTDKGGYKISKPTIQIVNEAIERTSRVTGVPPAEVVKRALIYAQMPHYGAAGIVAADSLIEGLDQPEQGEQTQ